MHLTARECWRRSRAEGELPQQVPQRRLIVNPSFLVSRLIKRSRHAHILFRVIERVCLVQLRFLDEYKGINGTLYDADHAEILVVYRHGTHSTRGPFVL